MRQELRRTTGVAVAVVALSALAIACSSRNDAGTAPGATPPASGGTPTAATAPEEALRLYVERRFVLGFTPDCDQAQRPGDVGKWCARFRGERDGMLAYELGPTFGEYVQLIILKPADGSWTIARLENRDPNLPPVPGIPWPLELGANVIVAGTGDCLRIRESPGVRAPEKDCLDDGTVVTVSDGPVEADGFEWWRLEGYAGWAASNWLRYPEEAPTTPTGEAP